MPILPLLATLPRIDATTAPFTTSDRTLAIPAAWALPSNIWELISRSARVTDAYAELTGHGVTVLRAGEKYVELVNGRGEKLFEAFEGAGLKDRWPRGRTRGRREVEDEAGGVEGGVVGEVAGDKGGEGHKQGDVLLKTGGATGWDIAYHRARGRLTDALGAFAGCVEDGAFMRLARVLCPSGRSKAALEEWFEMSVGELVKEAPGWLEKGFRWRDVLKEMVEAYPQMGIWADVLDATGGDAGVVVKRMQVYDLRHGSLAPLCRCVWVTESLANRIADVEKGNGPVA